MNAKTWHSIRFDPTQKPEPGTCEVDLTHPLAQGLIGFWPFNEGAGRSAIDLTGPKAASVISGATWQDTIRGRCLSFNGTSDYVETVPMRIPPGDRTFAAWVRLTAAGSFPMVISDTSNNSELRFSSNTQKPEWNSKNGVVNIVAPSAVTLNSWHLLCGVTGAMAYIFVDGLLVAGVSSSAPPLLSSGVVRFGARTGGSQFFAGNIDSPMIYQRGLLASEVGWLYAEPYAMLRPVSRVTYSIPSVSGLLLKRRRMFAA